MTRKEAREQAFALIFENCFQDLPLEEMLENAADGRDLTVSAFAKSLVQTVLDHRQEIDREIEAHSKNWKIRRIPRINLAILRLAVGEIRYFPDIPDSVSVNEAVELAKKYSGEEDYGFINGVLGGMLRSKPLPAESAGGQEAALDADADLQTDAVDAAEEKAVLTEMALLDGASASEARAAEASLEMDEHDTQEMKRRLKK